MIKTINPMIKAEITNNDEDGVGVETTYNLNSEAEFAACILALLADFEEEGGSVGAIVDTYYNYKKRTSKFKVNMEG